MLKVTLGQLRRIIRETVSDLERGGPSPVEGAADLFFSGFLQNTRKLNPNRERFLNVWYEAAQQVLRLRGGDQNDTSKIPANLRNFVQGILIDGLEVEQRRGVWVYSETGYVADDINKLTDKLVPVVELLLQATGDELRDPRFNSGALNARADAHVAERDRGREMSRMGR